ncbi:MAG TPA: dihydrofolate reductase [Casimicrobiaceae bacterium]|nr:dihydrofolate reductase [Casimicrobiaceae bacterium]
MSAGAPPAQGGAREAPASSALAIVAAVAANGVIGRAGGLPWRLPPDLRHFRALTTGHAVIMGRRTWASLGRALPERQNIVVTRNAALDAAGAETAPSLASALASVRLPAPAFCIGGAELYREALPLSTLMHLTELDDEFEGETLFPPFDRRSWREVGREAHVHDGLRFAFVTYRRER